MSTPAHPTGRSPGFNETLMAIVVSLVIALVLATLLTGNPFRATILAYTDYSHTPAAAGVPEASDTRAPATQSPNR